MLRDSLFDLSPMKIFEIKQDETSTKLFFIPNEIWILIFDNVVCSLNPDIQPIEKERSLRNLGLICHFWLNLIRELIPMLAKHLKITDWILSQFPSIEVLDLSQQCTRFSKIDERFFISNTALGRLTNLKELSLDKNTIIKSNTIKKLTSLTKLNLTTNRHITNNGISDLINLKWLSLHDNSRIDEGAFLTSTNLEYLDIQDATLVSNRVVNNLPKLTTLLTDRLA